MRRRDRRRATAALVLAALVLATGANGARAQTIDTSSSSGGTSLASQFGGFKIDAHGEGLSMTYDSPGLIPGTPSPLAAGSLPESLSTMDNGPSGYALASLVYPGPLLADLPSVLALGGVPNASSIPSYPVRSQAYFPSGPTTADQQIGSGRETVRTDESSATATTTFGAAQIPPVLSAGNIVSTTDTHLEQGQVVSRVRVELTDVDLVFGLVHMDSIVTDLVATSNAADAATAGTTTVSGVSVLGLPATIDAQGIHTQPQQTSGPTTTAGPLGPVGNALAPGGDALSTLMTSVLGSAGGGMDQLLAASGISVKLLDPVETKSGAEASRLASGLLITMTYNGRTEPVLSQVLAAIPEQSLPSQGVGPIPFSSPQSMVEAMKATHIITLSLGSGNVHGAAAPPFDVASLGSTSGLGSSSLPLASSTVPAGGRFTTPKPALGTGGGQGNPGGGSVLSAVPIALSGSEPLAGAVALMILVLAGFGFWALSTRLADNVLAATSTSCPDGLDRPPTAGGTP